MIEAFEYILLDHAWSDILAVATKYSHLAYFLIS